MPRLPSSSSRPIYTDLGGEIRAVIAMDSNTNRFLVVTTNNMAIYYFNLEDFKGSAEYVKLAYKKDFNMPKCLNPTLVKLLKEKNLINLKEEINN